MRNRHPVELYKKLANQFSSI